MKKYLPDNYSKAIAVIINSLTPPLQETSNLGLSGLFYLPHVSFVERFGLDKTYNNDEYPFGISMNAQFELTKRFSAEILYVASLLISLTGRLPFYIIG